MNKIILNVSKVFALMLITLATHLAHANILNNGEKAYTINVGTFAGASMEDFMELRKFGYVYSENVSGEIGRIFLGGYEDKKIAEEVLNFVRETGFAEATLDERFFKKGRDIYVIQLATRNSIEEIAWDSYQTAGDVYIYLKDTYVKIAIGLFENQTEADAQLERLRKLGFKDAFPKKINSVLLHQINAFDKGSPTTVLAENSSNTKKDIPLTSVKEEDLVHKGGEDLIQLTPKNKPIPMNYGDILTLKAPKQIRTNKRNSVRALQAFLKEQKYFNDKTSGIYNDKTAKGINDFQVENLFYTRYKTLAKTIQKEVNVEASDLENIINNIPSNPTTAAEKLKTKKEAIAKAFLAYVNFNPDADHNLETNDLMNEAIDLAFKDFKGEKAPFDYKATYAYKDYSQLIQHLSYIFGEEKNMTVPCWLFVKHPMEMATSFKADFKIQNCGSFLNWDNAQVLMTIAKDLNIETEKHSELKAKLQAKQNKLLILPEKPSNDEKQEMKAWHEVFWLAVNDWSDEDPFHAKFVEPLKLSYHRLWIELEDFYMDKGFSQPDANTLALSVLKTMLEPNFVSYLR